MNYSLNALYRVVGISKQAVYQYEKRQLVFNKKVWGLMIAADELRKVHPGCGVEKMYYVLKPNFIGRDQFIELFMRLGYRLKRKKNYRRTTLSGKLYYPNLIKGLQIKEASKVWQSDITYYRIADRFYYIVFIIDVYTKKIVGYSIANHMRAEANLAALTRALKQNQPPTIHHSDRGSQYISRRYINLLKTNKSQISMSLIAQDNAYAERINRTIKEEYLDYWRPKNLSQLKRQVAKAVKQYNTQRPHNSINKQSPKHFEKQLELTSMNKRKTLTIFNDIN